MIADFKAPNSVSSLRYKTLIVRVSKGFVGESVDWYEMKECFTVGSLIGKAQIHGEKRTKRVECLDDDAARGEENGQGLETSQGSLMSLFYDTHVAHRLSQSIVGAMALVEAPRHRRRLANIWRARYSR